MALLLRVGKTGAVTVQPTIVVMKAADAGARELGARKGFILIGSCNTVEWPMRV
jgi:hypothetical protein